MDDQEREEYEDRIVNEALEQVLAVLTELFEIATHRIQGMTMLRWFPEPDSGYTGKGRNDPEAEFTVGAWTLWIHEVVTEMVGGKSDGAEVYSGFEIDLTELIQEIHEPRIEFVTEVGLADLMGIPHVSISGKYKDLHVTVNILSRPPPDEPPLLRTDDRGAMWEIDDADDEDDEDDES